MEGSSTNKLKPIIDTREPEELRQVFRRAGWSEQALPSGDFCFYDSVGEAILVERKTVKQFLTDMTSGQLQRQARVLVEATAFPILLIEGHWTQNQGYLADSRHTWAQAWNQLQTLQDIGCRLQLTSSLDHTIERVFQLEEYYSKEFHSSISRHPSGDTRLACLSLVYGIGQNTGKAILDVLPSLAQVSKASVEELIAVDGVGPKLAQRIYQFWRQG